MKKAIGFAILATMFAMSAVSMFKITGSSIRFF